MIDSSLNVLVYILMPISYAVVGWFTNILALKMTFYPLRFVGIPPYLGWQGIVPRKAKKMASHAVKMITTRLINIHEVIGKIDPIKVEEALHLVMSTTIQDILHNILDEVNQNLSSLVPHKIKKQILESLQKDANQTLHHIVNDFKNNVDTFFDLENMVVRYLSGDNVKLMVEMFETVGWKEFQFIKYSGFIFGLLLGMIQAVLWLVYPIWWTIPLQGCCVGYFTNDMALRMIFRPLEEKIYFGFIRYQGLFLKRKKEVCRSYASLISREILTGKNILVEILYGYSSQKITELIHDTVTNAINQSTEKIGSLASLISEQKFESAKKYSISRMMDMLPDTIQQLESYLDDVLCIEETIATKMEQLSNEEFESILRSGFQEDELLLLLVGGFIGGCVGLLQVLYLIGR